MRRAAWLLGTALSTVGLEACSDLPNEPAASSVSPSLDVVDLSPPMLGDALAGLTPSQLAAFARGRLVFIREFEAEEGLGPTFNASSCAECHGEPEEGGVAGGAGDEVETHFTRIRRLLGVCDPLTNLGGFVRQDSVTSALYDVTGLTLEPLPSERHQTGSRTTVDLFGFGLLEAIPNRTLLSLADPFDRDGDGISGRAHFTAAGDIGKFGRKAQEGSLARFNADAFRAEMGITSTVNSIENTIGGAALPEGVDPTPEPELSDADLADLNAFVLFLAPPAQLPLTSEAFVGRTVFKSTGCVGCHVPSLTTGYVGVPALSFKRVQAFTDLLLHNMGPELADICLDQAEPSEFRTEPLMGLRFMEQFLHDGRASTIEEAISFHGGEASRSRRSFFALQPAQREALLAYLKSL